VLAFGAMVGSGLLAAIRPFGTGLLGPFGWPAQACALVALAAALICGTAGTVGTVGEPGPVGGPGTVGGPGASGILGASETAGEGDR